MSKSRDGLQCLAAGLLERSPRDLPALPDLLEMPRAPSSTLPPALRRRLVTWLEPLMGGKKDRRNVASFLRLDRHALEGFGPTNAASAAVTLATQSDDPRQGALRIIGILLDELDEDETAERLGELTVLRDELAEKQPNSEEAGLVGTWLRKVVRDHERLVPYFQQQTELDLLDRVYVQLELRRGAMSEELRRGEMKMAPGRAWTIRDLLDLDPEKHSWVTRRWVVIGDPGAGKTTLLRHLAATLAQATPPTWIPVLESLPRLLREPEWLLDRLERQLRRAGADVRGLASALDRAGQEGRLLVLLDGLDEVPREVQGEAEEPGRRARGGARGAALPSRARCPSGDPRAGAAVAAGPAFLLG